jgi:hypothetical protein
LAAFKPRATVFLLASMAAVVVVGCAGADHASSTITSLTSAGPGTSIADLLVTCPRRIEESTHASLDAAAKSLPEERQACVFLRSAIRDVSAAGDADYRPALKLLARTTHGRLPARGTTAYARLIRKLATSAVAATTTGVIERDIGARGPANASVGADPRRASLPLVWTALEEVYERNPCEPPSREDLEAVTNAIVGHLAGADAVRKAVRGLVATLSAPSPCEAIAHLAEAVLRILRFVFVDVPLGLAERQAIREHIPMPPRNSVALARLMDRTLRSVVRETALVVAATVILKLPPPSTHSGPPPRAFDRAPSPNQLKDLASEGADSAVGVDDALR